MGQVAWHQVAWHRGTEDSTRRLPRNILHTKTSQGPLCVECPLTNLHLVPVLVKVQNREKYSIQLTYHD